MNRKTNVSASKPATPISAIRTGVDSHVPKDVKWSSVRENRENSAKHRPPKVVKLPSGHVVKR